jgi:hypothetical protein
MENEATPAAAVETDDISTLGRSGTHTCTTSGANKITGLLHH